MTHSVATTHYNNRRLGRDKLRVVGTITRSPWDYHLWCLTEGVGRRSCDNQEVTTLPPIEHKESMATTSSLLC